MALIDGRNARTPWRRSFAARHHIVQRALGWGWVGVWVIKMYKKGNCDGCGYLF